MNMTTFLHDIEGVTLGQVEREEGAESRVYYTRSMTITAKSGAATFHLFSDTNEALIPDQEHAVNAGTAAERAAERQMVADALAEIQKGLRDDLHRMRSPQEREIVRAEINGVQAAARALHQLFDHRPGRFDSAAFLDTALGELGKSLKEDAA